MKSKRTSIPKALQNQVCDQCGYACANPTCRRLNTSSHQIHHVDEDPSHSVLENLILLCANCHADHHNGIISEAQVTTWKRMAEHGYLPPPAGAPPSKAPMMRDNYGVAAENIRVENLTVKTPRGKSGKTPPIPGTIGADADMRDYANYLVKKYIEGRKKGIARGTDRRPFAPGSASTILSEGFGSQTVLMIPAHRFADWVPEAQKKIDNTIWGRQNPHRNYHTWEEHLAQRHGPK